MYVCRKVDWYVGMYVHMCMNVCMHACMYVCIYVCMRVCMHVCVYVFWYVCMYVYFIISSKITYFLFSDIAFCLFLLWATIIFIMVNSTVYGSMVYKQKLIHCLFITVAFHIFQTMGRNTNIRRVTEVIFYKKSPAFVNGAHSDTPSVRYIIIICEIYYNHL